MGRNYLNIQNKMYLIKTLNFAKAIIFANLFGKKTPINIMWRITNKCNFKCRYCQIWKEKNKELTTEQVLSLIDQMKKCGTQRIGFVGGEAFLRKDFEQIINYVKEKGIFVTLVSNGSLVPKNLRIAKKLDCLILSFDGKKENHEGGRTKGNYDRLMETFELCKKHKIKVVTITVLNKYNLNDIDYVLDMAKKYGFTCNFHLLQGGWYYYPSDSQYRKALDLIAKRKKQGAPILLSLKTINFLKNWPDYKEFISKKDLNGPKCRAGQLIFNIDTDGRIAGCDILTHIIKDNPSCLEFGFEKAYKSVQIRGCKTCTCGQMIDYNYMFSLSPSVIFNWGKLIFERK